MPTLPTLPDGTVLYPGMRTLTNAAGTFAIDQVTDGVLHFDAIVPLDRWTPIMHCAVDEHGVTGRWRPRDTNLFFHGQRAWELQAGHTLYMMALAASSRLVEIEVRQDDHPRSFSGPWLKKGWALVKPFRFPAGSSPFNDIMVRGIRERDHGRGTPIAIDLSYLLVLPPPPPPPQQGP